MIEAEQIVTADRARRPIENMPIRRGSDRIAAIRRPLNQGRLLMRARRRFSPGVEPVEGRTLLNTAHPAPATSAANTPPVILQTDELIQAKTVVAFQVTFTKDVNPAPLSNLSHYALFDQARRNPFGRSPVPLASATYDPAQRTLTLAPVSPAPVAPYILTSPNPADRSTAFIADAQGRPLLTATRDFTVYFQPLGVSLRNFVLTSSPAINHMTGASLVVPALASIRSDENRPLFDPYDFTHVGVAGLGLLLLLHH